MNPDDDRLAEHLKRLDQVQASQEVPEFDLDAAITGGERRVRRRTALGTALGTAGAGLVLALAFSGALPSSFWSDEAEQDERPAPTPPPAVVDLAYAQSGDSVTVSSDDGPVALVTLSKAYLSPQGIAEVEVTVDAESPFMFDPSAFIWAGESLDRVPRQVHRELTVERYQRLSWSYDEASAGELAWTLPGTDRPAAVWSVGVDTEPTAVRPDRVWYLQQENKVTVYEGDQAQAQVSISEVAVLGGAGYAQVRLTARGQYELRADDFVWSSGAGFPLAGFSGAGSSEPVPVEPGSSEPGPAPPGPSEPGPAEPGASGAGSSESGPSEAPSSAPGSSGAGTSDAGSSGAGSSGAGSSGAGSSGAGTQHAPVADGWKSLIVTAAWGSSSAPLKFDRVEEGYLLWAPGGQETAGVWASSPS